MSIQAACLFPEAATYPDFFNRHLVDPNRILKVVTGQSCWARAFYFQLLKAVFEGDGQEQRTDYGDNLMNLGSQAKQKIRDHESREILSTSLDIIAYFMSKLSEDPDACFEDYINRNPDVDQAFTRILIAIAKLTGTENRSSLEKIKHCAELFDFRAYEFDKGIKFEQSDTFLYVENESTIYLVFLNLVSSFETDHATAEQEHGCTQSQQGIQAVDSDRAVVNDEYKKAQDEALSPLNTAVIEDAKKQSPVEYLFTNKFRSDTSKQSKQPEPSESGNQSRVDKSTVKAEQNNLEFTLGNSSNNKNHSSNISGNNNTINLNESQPFKILNSRFVKHADTVEEHIDQTDFKNASRESIVEERYVNRNESQKNQTIKESVYFRPDKVQANYVPAKDEKQQLFYKPVDARNLKRQNLSSEGDGRKQAFDAVNESEKGTFYRKFTDTRILNLISEPYRTKVKMLKNRFVGIHARSHRDCGATNSAFFRGGQ